MYFVGALQGNLVLNTKGFTSSIGNAKESVKSFKSTLSGITSNLRQAAREFRLVGAAATAGLGMMVRHAMMVEEAENLFEVSFGKMADDARKWSDNVAESLGMAAYQVREGAGTFAVMTQSMGLSEEASASLSRNLLMLAADMASFYNLPHEEALMKLQAGLTGEAEPLKRLGVLVNETTVEQYALREGIIKTGQELTEQQKVVARYGLIMEQTEKAQGDLARTATSSTNQFRLLKAQFAEITADLGGMLLPMVNRGVRTINAIVDVTRAWYEGNEELIGGLFVAGSATVTLLAGLTALGFVINPLTTSVKLLGKAFAIAWTKAAAPILPFLGAVAAVGVAAYTLRAVWKQNVGGIKDEWDRLTDHIAKDFWLDVTKDAITEFCKWVVWKIGQTMTLIGETLMGPAAFVSQFLMDPMDFEKAVEAMKAQYTLTWEDLLRTDPYPDPKKGTDMDFTFGKLFIPGFGEAADTGAVETEVSNLGEVASGVAKQFKEDWAGAFEWFKGEVPELASTIESLFKEGAEGEGYKYDPLDIEGLLAGIEETTGKVSAAASKQAKELLQAVEGAERLKQSLDPVRAAYQGILEDIETLNSAGSYTAEWQAKLADSWAEQLKEMDWNDVTAVMEQVGAEHAQFADDVMTRIQAITQEAKELAAMDLLAEMRPESMQALDDIVAKIELLKETGNFDDAMRSNILSPYFWQQWGHLTDEEFNTLIAHLSQVSVEADMVAQRLIEIRELLPELTEETRDMRQAWSGLSQIMDNIGQGLMDMGEFWGSELLGKIGSVHSAISNIINAMLVYQSVMQQVGNTAMAMWMKILGPIYLVIAAITTVIELAGVFGDKSKEVKKGWEKALDDLKQKLDEWADELTDTIIEFVKTGEFEFERFIRQVMEDILRITLSEVFIRPLIHSIAGGIYAKGAAFAGGEVVPFASGGIAMGPTYFPMRDGKTGLMGEAGPEAIMPLERTSDGGLGVRARGGQTTVNIIDQRGAGAPPVEQQRRRTADGEEIRLLIRDAVADSIAKGDMDTIFGMTYGLHRGRA